MADRVGPSMDTLRRLHQVTGRVNAGGSLSATLQAVVDGVVDVVGFEVAVVSFVHGDGSFETLAVAGNSEAREQLLGRRMAAESYDAELALADRWGELRFVPHERLPAGQVDGWVPQVDVLDVPDAWHPLDALYAPLRAPAGNLVGMLSVDLPHDRRRPGPFQRELLEIFATQAGIAINNARLTEQLRASEEGFRQAFEGAGTGMAVIDLTSAEPGRYLRVNPAMCRLLGRTEDELLQCRFDEITHPDDRGPGLQAMADTLAGDTAGVSHQEKRYLRASGALVWVAVTTSVVTDGSGSALYAISQVEDISAQRAAREELTHRANHDILTGLPNRHILRERLAEAIGDRRRVGAEGAVLFCDLDGFKAVNDNHGHAVGDLVLTEVARRLASESRQGDLVARLGGDEFVLVARATTPDQAADLAGRLQVAVAQPVTVHGLAGQVRVALSVGVATIPLGDVDADSMLEQADEAMYHAKLGGRGVHVLATAEFCV